MDDLPTLGEKMATFNVDPVANLYLYFRILVFLGSPLPFLSCILVILTLGTEQHPLPRAGTPREVSFVVGHVSEFSLPSFCEKNGMIRTSKGLMTNQINHGISIDPAHSANV